MGRRHFLTVLGAGRYNPVGYKDTSGKKEPYRTSYVQEAILEVELGGNFSEDDKITVIMTKEAKNKHWFREDQDKDKSASNETEEKTLGQILTQRYPDTTIAVKDIPKGQNEKEFWEIFKVISDAVSDDDDLYVDITHGFRYQPFLMMSVLSFVRVVNRNVRIMGVYYGLYEPNEPEAPILDLTKFISILDWTQAAKVFRDAGDAAPIKILFEEERKNKKMSGQGSKSDDAIRDVIFQMMKTTDAVDKSRGCQKHDDGNKKSPCESSISMSAKKYRDSYEKMINQTSEKDTMVPPMRMLLQVVDDKLKIFDEPEGFEFLDKLNADETSITNLKTGIAATMWNVEYKNVQQGLTSLDETIKTFLCVKYGLDETKKEYREALCKNICNILLELKNKRTEAIEIDRSEAYHIWEERTLQWKISFNEDEKKIAKKLSEEIPDELLDCINSIRAFRNNINHFGFSTDVYSPDILMKNLKKWAEKALLVMKEELMYMINKEGQDDNN